jgi:SAM-dependent methyltransferase/N-acetylglutamate synthase-like GNAT family acetyltransferase
MQNTERKSRGLPLANTGCCSGDVPTGWLVREARASDLDAVRALLAGADLPTEGVADQFGPSYAVAEEHGRVIAAVGIERHGAYGLLRSAVVAPSHRGKGVGEALVHERLDWSLRQSLAAVYLLTTSAADYFPRFGFQPIARDAVPAAIQATGEFSSLCPSTSTVMQLQLEGGAALRQLVRFRYGTAARRAQQGDAAGCGCGCSSDQQSFDPITSNLYDEAEKSGLPLAAVLASLGCGNPTALAELRAGEVVLDLGSGGGIDVLLSARRVGPTGQVYGLDMTDEMLALARANQQAAGVRNVEFLKGEIENIPLPDSSVDVIISNCVINLAADKRRVLQEAFRVLKPGGRLAVSDVVVRGPVPDFLRRSMELWVGCVAGALEEQEYRTLLAGAGFQDIELEPTRIYRAADAAAFLSSAGLEDDEMIAQVDGRVMSAFVRATRPA